MDNILSVDKYIGTFDQYSQEILHRIRKMVLQTSPSATEMISYGLIGFKLKGKPLIYFGAFKKHIGLYATPSGNQARAEHLKDYNHGKGSIKFPLDREIPFDLIQKIIEIRVNEIEQITRQ